MSDIIKLLPDSVANQIAAGEVIQRPASVIKELIENSVDAGATEIQVIIKDAGRTLIQVIDNGRGMSETDARLAFERHATSKIRNASDLFALHTMGFRGEALPSICAVSQVEIKTKTKDSNVGTRLLINATKVENQEPVICETGTSIMVKNLFFNVPARRKFLKSDTVETANIMREFERLALVNNEVRMSISVNGKQLELRSGSFLQRIGELWKNSLDLHLIPLDVDTSLIKISGFVSRPENARRRNALQYLIVNGRNMRHPYFHKAIVSCYDSLIAPETQPCYFLKFDVDPASIDVNIHPTKNEIKFEHEQEIWPIIHSAVKAALGKFGAVPSIDFNSDVLPVSPLSPGEKPKMPTLDLSPGYNPFGTSAKSYPEYGKDKRDRLAPKNWDELYVGFMNNATENPVKKDSRDDLFADEKKDNPESIEKNREPVDAVCFQFSTKYIVTPSGENLIIIDQHRAHVKILYEKFLALNKKKINMSQILMFPEFLDLDLIHREAFQEIEKDLVELGFVFEKNGEAGYKIMANPRLPKNSSPVEIVSKILDTVIQDGSFRKVDDLKQSMTEHIALLMAKMSAVQRGRKLTVVEMENIISDLFSLPDPRYTPSGNPIFITMTKNDIESKF